MNLELDKIAIARSRKNSGEYGVSYLLQRIRSELWERIADREQVYEKGLVVDFDTSHAWPGSIVSPVQRSMFEFFASPQDFFDPYRGQEFDCVVLNLMTSWSGFDQVVAGVYDVLRPGGVIAFSAFGPDTLHEIRSAWARVDQGPHVHPCMDMHHLGDSLLNSGFSRPIVDADWIRVDYPDMRTLTLDLRHAGFGNILENRRKTLTGKHRYAKFLDQIASISEETPDLGITFEVVYGFGTRQGDSHADIGRVLVSPPQRR